MLRARCPMRRQPVSPYRTHAAPSVRPCVRAPIAASAQPELRQLAVQLLARQSQAARGLGTVARGGGQGTRDHFALQLGDGGDRKSTRLNSSHLVITYAVFCLKKNSEFDNAKDLRGSMPRLSGL